MTILPRRTPASVANHAHSAVDAETLRAAGEIVEDVRRRGWTAVCEHALLLGDVTTSTQLVYTAADLQRELDRVNPTDVSLLKRSADQIRAFAVAQRAALTDFSMPLPGGRGGHRVIPVQRAGCYAPGGRYPLPSSVLMTAVTARAAGVQEVWIASPRPSPITLAAAAISGADGLIAIGGAQAIAAMAFGTHVVPRCDMVVGPGNRWVTAAKQLLSGEVGIDMLAGPSELLIIADHTAPPALIAADLLAQAEHDSDAVPMVLCTSAEVLEQVELELEQQLRSLPSAATAEAACANGFAVLVPDLATAIALSDALAPEHLEIMTADASAVAAQCRYYGGIFIGAQSAEVFGDYAIGPNHVLPTGRTARFASGLSVHTFLKVRTWIERDVSQSAEQVIAETARFARLEGLEGHARAAEARRTT